jgi:hypothetical protein
MKTVRPITRASTPHIERPPKPMATRLLRIVNVILLIATVLMISELTYKWNKLRPRTVYGIFPVECADDLDSDAHYLALICQAIIKEKGSLPHDPAEAAHVIAENATKLGFTWPNNFRINAAGQICDCKGKPFQISVLPDRVAITSESLYGFYFAELKNQSSHPQ